MESPESSEENNDWETQKSDRIGRMSYPLMRQTRLDLSAHTHILDEGSFQETFAEHNSSRRTAEGPVPPTSKFPKNGALKNGDSKNGALKNGDPEHDEFSVSFEIADLEDAAILLNSQEIDVVFQALEALIAWFGLSEGTSDDDDAVDGDKYLKVTLINCPGFLKRVLHLTSSSFKSLRRRAVVLLGFLSAIEEAVEQFESIPCLNKVADLIEPGTEPAVLDWAVFVLKNLAILKKIQNIFLDQIFLLERLLDLLLLDNQDVDVVENGLEALCHLSANQEIRRFLVLNGGFEVAVELASSEFPSTQYLALRLMRELICCPAEGVIDRFHEADGLATIVEILKKEEMKFLQASSLQVLEFLMGVPSIAQELSQKGIHQFLLDLALSKEYQDLEASGDFAIFQNFQKI
jgi:hypothetical protein